MTEVLLRFDDAGDPKLSEGVGVASSRSISRPSGESRKVRSSVEACGARSAESVDCKTLLLLITWGRLTGDPEESEKLTF